MADEPRPIADLDAAVRDCRTRDRNEEGIPTFLVLEDLDDAVPERPSVEGETLGRLADEYLGRLAGDPERATLADVATVFEVLGMHHFDPGPQRR